MGGDLEESTWTWRRVQGLESSAADCDTNSHSTNIYTHAL